MASNTCNHYPLGRLQWVFWSWSSRAEWAWGLHRFAGGLRKIYRWSFQLGPVELRHWTPVEDKGK